jgi:stress response protein SCP2
MLPKGANVKIEADIITVNIDLQGIGEFDLAALGIKPDGKIYAPQNDEYIALFSQPSTPEGAIKFAPGYFAIDLKKIPAEVDKIVIAASIPEGESRTMAALTKGQVDVLGNGKNQATYNVQRSELDGKETSLILGEVYRKNGEWKFKAVGAGFKDGFAALLKSFGVVITDTPAPAAPAAKPVNLQKVRLEKLELQKHPLVDLAKKARISLEKNNLGDFPAIDFEMVLDTSLSMKHLYANGIVQKLAERLLALAAVLDDDGSVPLVGFDARGKVFNPPIDLGNYAGHVNRVVGGNYGYDTRYATGIDLARGIPATHPWVNVDNTIKSGKTPRVVLFLTDGDANDRAEAIKQIQASSREPVFFVFAGVGNAKFTFLEELDDLKGRFLDNVSVMTKEVRGKQMVVDASTLTDEELYAGLMKELPKWLQQAKEFGLVSDNPQSVQNNSALKAKIAQKDQQAKAELSGSSAPRRGFF